MGMIFYFLFNSLAFANPIAYSDGPNCFNATLVGKGYVQEFTHTDPGEFAFFIEKFCKKVSRLESPGDIITVDLTDSYIHAALALSNGNIFEKLSTWGLNPKVIPPENDGRSQASKDAEVRERKISSQYLTRPKKDSRYFNEEKHAGADSTVSVYACADASEVQRDLRSATSGSAVRSILQLNKTIEALVFTKKLDPNWREVIANKISGIASKISQSEVKGEQELFLLVKAWSLSSQIWHLKGMGEYSSSESFESAFAELTSAIATLENKVVEDRSDLSQRVLKARNSN